MAAEKVFQSTFLNEVIWTKNGPQKLVFAKATVSSGTPEVKLFTGVSGQQIRLVRAIISVVGVLSTACFTQDTIAGTVITHTFSFAADSTLLLPTDLLGYVEAAAGKDLNFKWLSGAAATIGITAGAIFV